MRVISGLVSWPILVLVLLPVAPVRAMAEQPYWGLWSTSKQVCRTDRDGVSRLEINGSGLFWYEERCRGSIKATGHAAWTARLSCEGEGKRQTVTTRLMLDGPDVLVLENAPVTPVKRQRYVRCATPRR